MNRPRLNTALWFDAPRSLCSALLDLVYPRACTACGGHAQDPGVHICWDCRSSLQLVQSPFCARCGDPADGLMERDYTCSWCRRTPPHFDRARSAARYRGPLQDALQSFKYRRDTCLARDLTDLLTACIRAHYRDVAVDTVAFVPLHAARERDRGYNQARLLAGTVARHMDLPLLRRGLRRTRATQTQTNLAASARRANVRGAFAACDDGWIAGRRFLLVDDVMTTGATVNECARVLKKAGAVSVYVATVARG